MDDIEILQRLESICNSLYVTDNGVEGRGYNKALKDVEAAIKMLWWDIGEDE